MHSNRGLQITNFSFVKPLFTELNRTAILQKKATPMTEVEEAPVGSIEALKAELVTSAPALHLISEAFVKAS